MRKAVIDLGTNTFNLLIADRSDDSISEVYSTKRGVALGMGGITKGILTEDAIERAIKALVEFEEIIRNYKVSSVKLIATAAVREANNSDGFNCLYALCCGYDFSWGNLRICSFTFSSKINDLAQI